MGSWLPAAGLPPSGVAGEGAAVVFFRHGGRQTPSNGLRHPSFNHCHRVHKTVS